MLRKLLPILLALVGLGAGAGAGFFLRPAPEAEDHAADTVDSAHEPVDAHAAEDESAEAEDAEGGP